LHIIFKKIANKHVETFGKSANRHYFCNRFERKRLSAAAEKGKRAKAHPQSRD